MLKVVAATNNEINQYFDQTCKLRPIKIKLKHYDNYTIVTYFGIGDLKLLSLNFPFILDETSGDIFDSDKLDREWCLENIDRIKVTIDTKPIVEERIIKKRESKCIIV